MSIVTREMDSFARATLSLRRRIISSLVHTTTGVLRVDDDSRSIIFDRSSIHGETEESKKKSLHSFRVD